MALKVWKPIRGAWIKESGKIEVMEIPLRLKLGLLGIHSARPGTRGPSIGSSPSVEVAQPRAPLREPQARSDEEDPAEVEAAFTWSPILPSLRPRNPRIMQMHDKYPEKWLG